MTTQTYPACLHTLARRLRCLRRYPNHASGNWGEDYTTGMPMPTIMTPCVLPSMNFTSAAMTGSA